MMQQTPKELAQFPSAVPADEHSVEVIQTPFNPDVDTAVHSSFLNVTMLNKENCLESFACSTPLADEKTKRQIKNGSLSNILLLKQK
jgi:hypothetical protein